MKAKAHVHTCTYLAALCCLLAQRLLQLQLLPEVLVALLQCGAQLLLTGLELRLLRQCLLQPVYGGLLRLNLCLQAHGVSHLLGQRLTEQQVAGQPGGS